MIRRPPSSPLSPYTTLFRSTVTIHGTNDVPTITGASTGAVTEDVSVASNHISTSGALVVSDVDAGQSHTAPQASTASTKEHTTVLHSPDHIVCHLPLHNQTT